MLLVEDWEDINIKNGNLILPEENGKLILKKENLKSIYVYFINKKLRTRNHINATHVYPEENSSLKMSPSIVANSSNILNSKKIDYFYIRISIDGREIWINGDIFSRVLDLCIGVSSGESFTRSIENKAVSISMENKEKYIITRNHLSEVVEIIEKENIKNGICYIIQDGNEYYGKGNIDICINKINKNRLTPCLMCKKIKEKKYISLFTSGPFTVCRDCIGDFLERYLECTESELLARII